jgi:serine/threonine protein kinase
VAERQFGPYRLVRQIAVGGMAEIHLAKTKGIAGFEKYVALKMIHPNFAEDEQFIQMLVDEAKIAVQLTHGNIAQTFDLGRVGETYYITMEYVDGADLYKILRRGSERDLEMPLDVCAFIGKEVASALDHAHRKKDHVGKPLGIVHRDVSPQNVLISYSGEVKLVDFGIAKATMKARQTAVGVIKGKYYYMSPEQAWGDPIDYRSDIFSAGIVLYEMITGQMLYLEEDLHKLLDMARKADIAPPSKLRKGVPPQLERIIMHALQKEPGDRYQSAGDFATDLERFLHAYSPVFTAGKIASLIKQVIGDPMQVPDDAAFEEIEIRDGVMSTHTLDSKELAHSSDRDKLQDENSVIFRVSELKPPRSIAPTPPPLPTVKPPAAAAAMARAFKKTDPPPPMKSAPGLPHGPPPPAHYPEAQIPSLAKPPPRPAVAKPPAKRQPYEETRQLVGVPPPGPNDEMSGLLSPQPRKVQPTDRWDSSDTHGDELDNIGERTIVTAAPGGGGFMMDAGGEDSVDATMITQPPEAPHPDTDVPDNVDDDRTEDDSDDEEGPTLARENIPAMRAPPRGRAQPPHAALAAKIHAPAVSELRKPKASRRTPPGGVPTQSNVLQQIVGAQASEPMPVPRPVHNAEALSRAAYEQPQSPQQFPSATPGGQPAMMYGNDASGLPMGIPTPPSGMPVSQPVPGVPPHLQPYLHMQGVPPGYPQYQQGHPGYPVQPGYPQMSPGALYQMNAYPVQQMSLTGQMRLFEADELPSMYKLGAARKRWFTYIVSGIIAVSVAALATFLIIRVSRETPAPTMGSIIVESTPPGAEVTYDGTRLAGETSATKTYTIDDIPLGSRHEIKVQLAGHRPHVETVDIPKTGAAVRVQALLEPVTGKLVVNSRPGGADLLINGQRRGVTPTTINDVDMNSAKKLELRLKDYQPHLQDLTWPADGKIDLDITLKR